MHSTSEAASRYLKEMKRALLAFPSSKSQASIPGHHGQKGRLRQRNAEQLLKATRPLLKIVSEHCCSLAKHILTLSFGDWDCFARSLALNVCDLKPSVGWKGSETTLWSSVKRYALKSTQKGVGILHWIISYRRESCALNPLDFTMSHSLRATLWSGEGECWPHSSGSQFKMINCFLKVFWRWVTALLLLCSPWAKPSDVARESEGIGHRASGFTVDGNCQSLVELCSLSAWQTP